MKRTLMKILMILWMTGTAACLMGLTQKITGTMGKLGGCYE